jgi:GT2 family glycosyltransferase
VRPFLKLCLHSVSAAARSLHTEVFVVDNASVDGSVEMVRSDFPFVKLLVNETNVGFSAANNLAITKASGKIILLLNPDTIVPEDTFKNLIKFYEAHPEASGVGAKMIDGTGSYLPESKRGLPSSRDFLFKISGLINVFPASEFISRYYMGHLSQEKTWEIPVLAGAFMAFPAKAVEKIGLMDEDFFMYGEDIDFSYRLLSAGKNYYSSDLKIIHFKGESTLKDKNYIDRFYGAMLIFSRKHYFSGYGKFRRFMVTSAIRAVKKILNIFILFNNVPKNSTLTSVNEVAFYVGGEEGYERVKHIEGFIRIKSFKAFSDVDVDENYDAITLFIDLKTVSVKDAVNFMEKYSGRFRFSFISPDRDFYLYSTGSKNPGNVIAL